MSNKEYDSIADGFLRSETLLCVREKEWYVCYEKAIQIKGFEASKIFENFQCFEYGGVRILQNLLKSIREMLSLFDIESIRKQISS